MTCHIEKKKKKIIEFDIVKQVKMPNTHILIKFYNRHANFLIEYNISVPQVKIH